MSWVQQLRDTFRKRSASELALEELLNARRELLEAQSAEEFAASVVQYNKARIARLEAYPFVTQNVTSTTNKDPR